MNVVDHRPIYARIGRAEPAVPVQRDLPNLVSYSPTEADRVWRLLRQCAEGTCGLASASDASCDDGMNGGD